MYVAKLCKSADLYFILTTSSTLQANSQRSHIYKTKHTLNPCIVCMRCHGLFSERGYVPHMYVGPTHV